MHIHLPGKHYYVNLFHPQAFVSEQSLSNLFIFCFFSGLFLGDMVAASLTSPGCLYRLELHIDSLFMVYQQGFFLSASLLRKI